MKSYEYVTVKYFNKDVVKATLTEHRDVIEQYSKKGYEFVTAIPVEIGAQGCIRKIDLVFSK